MIAATASTILCCVFTSPSFTQDTVPHWAFVPLHRPLQERSREIDAWAKNPIDGFVRAQLLAAGRGPSPEADRATLARRLAFDLTGLPPRDEERAAFLSDASEGGYDRYVDRLLDSVAYGERMAMSWLDAARYSDTDGYQVDATRQSWPWRDWVIASFRDNVAFDQFTVEQLAGDLLPDPCDRQILATAFHRQHMANGEGGRDPEESRSDYVIDRVNTTATVWLGLSLSCSQCHDHKHDPLSQVEFYGMAAFFDSIDEDGHAGGAAKPVLSAPPPPLEDAVAAAESWLSERERAVEQAERDVESGFAPWLAQRRAQLSAEHEAYRPFPAKSLATTGGAMLTQAADGSFVVLGPNARHEDYVITTTPGERTVTGFRLTILPGDHGRLSLAEDGHVILTNVKVSVATRDRKTRRDITLESVVADYESKKSADKAYGPVRDVLDDDPRTGWWTGGRAATEEHTATFAFRNPVKLAAEEALVFELWQRSLSGSANIRRFRLTLTDEGGAAPRRMGPTPAELLARTRDDPDTELLRDLKDQYHESCPSVVMARAARAAAKKRRDRSLRFSKEPVKVMVLGERATPRITRLLNGGAWDAPGDPVAPQVPAAVGPALVARGARPDRLDLARWLVDPRNPLTARVAVNRLWQLVFGVGLVRTPGDFGMKGERPTHPELLEWLAVEFQQSGWDVRRLVRLMVTSATYRQSSDASPEAWREDPENRLFGRGTRHRRPSWMLRDAALAAGGLLTRRVFGPPVFPPQPEGVWEDATMGRFTYEASVGDDRFRRSLYTFWRRLVAPTFFFDASKRQLCEVRIVRTNTPLQALTLLNDESMIAAAVALGASASRKSTDAQRIAFLFERVLLRGPDDVEQARLREALNVAREHFRQDPSARTSLLEGHPVPEGARDDVAALALVANLIMNLDEAISRR